MTRATLIRANLRRRLSRTILTVLGLGVALFLFVTLRTFLHGLTNLGDVGSETRLIVSSRLGMIFDLPLAYRARLSSQDGVDRVSYATWFGATYGEGGGFFANYGVDAETYFPLYPEMVVPPAEMQAFVADRMGTIVGVRLMERYGWKVGQTVPLRGTIYPGEHRFTIRGVYHAGKKGFDQTAMVFHHRYVEEIARAEGRPVSAGWYVLGLTDPQTAPTIASAIDNSYENSSSPTRSQTEKAFNLNFVGMFGNIGFFLNAIGMAVVFAIALVAANTMAMSARERFGEIAVLKTLGFTDTAVLRLVVTESLIICGLGLAIGLGGALLIFNVIKFDMGGFFPGLTVTPEIMLVALGIALVITAVSSLVPAWQSARLQVIDALRYVA